MCIRSYFIDFNKLLTKKRQFRIAKFLLLKNCNFLDIQNLLLFPRNPFYASHQDVLGGPKDWERSRGISGVPGVLGVPWSPGVQGVPEVQGVPGAPTVLESRYWVLLFHHACSVKTRLKSHYLNQFKLS